MPVLIAVSVLLLLIALVTLGALLVGFAVGLSTLDPTVATRLVAGIVGGCIWSGTALVGWMLLYPGDEAPVPVPKSDGE